MRTNPRVRPEPIVAARALRGWRPRQWATATLAAIVTAVAVGVPTVLIPNPWFGREIDPTWWSYPAWIAASVLAGLLLATYVRPQATGEDLELEPTALEAAEAETEDRSRKLGIAGTMLTWFAVGCPVCNKLVLVALGSSGAMTWFAPAQPILALAAIGVTTIALMTRLSGQVACPVPAVSR